MGILNVPKAVYKAQQAKKQMSKIEAAGTHNLVSILMNGLNEITEVGINTDEVLAKYPGIDADQLRKLIQELTEDFRKATADAKKQVEKELVSSTSLEDLKSLLG